jgi:NDP-sugar pyrophosphorylase family protein
VKAFVLAAGFGSRLKPITEVLPKPLMPIGDVPLIGYALTLLAKHGITEVAVNTHHLGKVLEQKLGDGSQFGVQITYSHEKEILGTGGGLRRMHPFLKDDTFVVINSDILIDLDLTAVIAQHKENNALATMVLREDQKQADYGVIEIDAADYRIRKILGQGRWSGQLRPLMFTGVHVMEPRLLEYIPPEI